mgnify:CR=1 FL=1
MSEFMSYDPWAEITTRNGYAGDEMVAMLQKAIRRGKEEDALHAARTAKQAGFLVAGVYEPSAEADSAQMRAVCDWYLPRLDDEAFLAWL